MSDSVDQGQILDEGIALARRCAAAMMMGENDLVYDQLDECEDPEVFHTAFIYAVTQWAHAMEVFMEEHEWAAWLLQKEMERDV